MPLQLITGQSGTGKSTLLREFRRRGLSAYGYDEDQIARHRFIASGEFLINTDYAEPGKSQIDWVHDIDYKTDPAAFANIESEANTGHVFLFGSADDTAAYYSSFDQIFALVVDEVTLRHRLKTRQGNDWGKKPHELEHILEQFQRAETEYRSAGAAIIDATRPIGAVADEILNAVS